MFPELGTHFAKVIDNRIKYVDTLIDDFSDKDKYPQIAISVDMLDTSLLINICIPYLSIEKVLDNLVIKNWFSTIDNEQGEEVKANINKTIKNVDVAMKAVLGETKISVNDFLNLFTGDIVTLDRSYDSTVDIYVEDELLFKAKPGLKGKNKAVQIIEYIDKGVENDG